MFKKIAFLLAMVAFVLTDCTTNITTSETTTVPSTAVRLPTQTSIPLPTQTSIPLPTQTSIPLPTQTSIPLPRTEACYNLQNPTPILSSTTTLEGVLGLIYPQLDQNADNQTIQVLLGGSSLQQEHALIPINDTGSIGFSPDGNWFAYQVLNAESNLLPEPFVYLISPNQDKIRVPLPLSEKETNGHWGSGWINNEYMILIYGLPSEDPHVSHRAFMVFNPFTGEKRPELLENLPYWNGETAVYFAPDMTRMVYAGRTEDDSILILWDVEHQKIIWQQKPFITNARFDELGIGMMSGFGQVATWAPDSTGFVFSAAERTEDDDTQLFSFFVDREGEQEKALISTSDPRNNSIIYGGVWSPDQRYLVYFSSESLMLYDFIFNEVIKLCPELPPYISQALWSPDSNYLAFMSPVNEQQHLLVLNIYTGEVFSIREIRNFFPAGWFPNEDWLQVTALDN